MMPFTLVPVPFGALLYDRREGRIDAFAADAAEVLFALCDRPAFEVARGSEAAGLVEELARRDALDGNGRLRARRVPGAGTVLPPITVHLEVSGVCNLSCIHCFAAPLPRVTGALERHELRALFDDAAALGAFRLSLTGGEPLLRRDILEVIDDAAAAGLSPTLITNGLVHDAALAVGLAERLADHRLLWLSVSLDGGTAATNDAIRGEGVFASVLAGLASLRAANAPFALAFTVHPALVREIGACVALAHDVGATTAVFRPLYPTGAAANRTALWLSRRDWDRAALAAQALGGTVAADDEQGALFPADACAAGHTQASISLDGRVSPCGFLGASHDGPSVRHVPLSASWRAHEVFVGLRAPNSAPDAFAGGCRVRAQAEAGSAFVRDPWQRGLPILSS